MDYEQRSNSAEVGAQEEGELKRIVGYAAVWHRAGAPGTEFQLAPDMFERVDPQAFEKSLASGEDVVALINHDPNRVIGRLSSGTLRLSADNVGLRYEIDLPDVQYARDFWVSVKRGDVKGSSFKFRVAEQGLAYERDGAKRVRVLKDVRLIDVGPVTIPAYNGTTSQARSSYEDEYRRLSEVDSSVVAHSKDIVAIDDWLRKLNTKTA